MWRKKVLYAILLLQHQMGLTPNILKRNDNQYNNGLEENQATMMKNLANACVNISSYDFVTIIK